MNRVKKTLCVLLLVTTPMLATAAQNPPAKKPSTEQAASEKAQPRNTLLQKITSVLDQVLRGDRVTILLESSPEAVLGDGVGAELVRVIRKIAQIERRLQAIESIIAQLRSSDLYRLKTEVEKAEAEGRDLLNEMVLRLDQQITDRRGRLASLMQGKTNRVC